MTVTITENDTPILSIGSQRAGEDEGEMVFAVMLSPAGGEVVAADYATQAGTAAEGVDYRRTAGTVTFPANSTAPRQIRVPIIDDADEEEDETFTVELGNARNAVVAVPRVEGVIVDDDAPPPPPPPPPPGASRIERVSGDLQEGPAGTSLTEPLVVEVRDENDDPLEGARVVFAVTAGDGTLSATGVTTGADGRASSRLTLGRTPGTNTVQVTVAGLEPVTFTAAGRAVADTLGKLSGDEQEGEAGDALGHPFVVEVRDQNGDPFPGAEVVFTVTAGDGTVSAAAVSTDAEGRASTTLTLGPIPGTNTVRAAVEGLDPVIFRATGLAVPRTLAKVSGDEQQAAAGAQLEEPLVVSVRDQNGSALPGAAVNFAVLGDGGTLSAASDTTGADGRASTTLTLGPIPGTNTVRAEVPGLEPVTFTAIGLAVPRTLTKVRGDLQHGRIGTRLADSLVVSVHDHTGSALPGALVTFTVTGGQGILSSPTDTTDAAGLASTALTLIGEPGTGTVEVAVADLEPVTFTATARPSPDFDGDGEIGFEDFFLFAEAFGGTDPRFDLDGSGEVDLADFFLFAESFGRQREPER